MTAQEMWAAYTGGTMPDTPYEAWAFGESPDLLAELVRTGVKSATSSAFDLYQLEGEPIPAAGQYSVILDSRENAVCVIRNTGVSVVPFDEVSPMHAWREGEDDRSLSSWRKVHEAFFTKELAQAELAFHWKTAVVCEEFEVVFPVYQGGLTDNP